MTLQEMLARQQAILAAARTAGRELSAEERREFEDLQRSIDGMQAEGTGTPAPGAGEGEGGLGEDQVRAQAAIQERNRITTINQMASELNIPDSTSEEWIRSGISIEEVNRRAIQHLRSNNTPVPMGGTPDVTRDGEDKFRAAVSDGLRMRAGLVGNSEKLAEGASDFRGLSLKNLAIECLVRSGENASNMHRLGEEEIFERMGRQFFNPSSAFAAIMDDAINKSIVYGYNQIPTTFERITTEGSLSNFKTSTANQYLIGGVSDFERVPENGEIKADKPYTDKLPERQLSTYAKSFSMSRQAFINDDIGFLSEVPVAYAQAAKKTINKAVYGILVKNPVVYDGGMLFNATHKNVAKTDGKPTQALIQEIILQMQKQTDPFGDPIYMVPKSIIVPMGYEFDLAIIFKSLQQTGSNNNDINPLNNYPLDIVQDPILNSLAGTNACPWFMQANPTTAKGIQVDYLNGKKVPSIRKSEKAGTLGLTWDIWLDWGISVLDFRGLYRNNGAVLQ